MGEVCGDQVEVFGAELWVASEEGLLGGLELFAVAGGEDEAHRALGEAGCNGQAEPARAAGDEDDRAVGQGPRRESPKRDDAQCGCNGSRAHTGGSGDSGGTSGVAEERPGEAKGRVERGTRKLGNGEAHNSFGCACAGASRTETERVLYPAPDGRGIWSPR